MANLVFLYTNKLDLRKILTLVSKVNNVSIISETIEEVVVFVINLSEGQWNLPQKKFSNVADENKQCISLNKLYFFFY